MKINNAIISEHTREGLFQALAREFSIFHYDRFSIHLYDPETDMLTYFASASGIIPQEINKKIRSIEKGSIAQLVIQSRKPVYIDDLSQNLHLATAKWMVKAGLNCTLAYPMVIRDTVIGSVHFSFKKAPPNVLQLREFLDPLSVQIAIAVDNMLSHNKLKGKIECLERERSYLLNNGEHSYQYQKNAFCYASSGIAKIMNDVKVVAATDATVLITGETGTGKGHLALTIHNLSQRKDRLFVKVNCAALAPTLVESELFGHAKGAFTGADKKRAGRFEMADKGTIFLDEIAELPLSTQVKLLQVLQDRTFERVGESSPIPVDIRIIAASNQDMKLKLQDKTFRSDLYYRLNVIRFHIPPLRERAEDIPLLAKCFTSRYSVSMGKPALQYTASAIEALSHYSWPGNVRELENVIERLMILRAGSVIAKEDINSVLNAFEADRSDKILTRNDMEKRHIEKALVQSGGVVGGAKGAAQLLGMRRTTLQFRMKKLGIEPVKFVGYGDK